MRQRVQSWMAQLFSTEGFRGPVLTLLSGTTLVMALAFLSQPILTRLYSQEAFGLSDYFVAVMSVLISFSSLRYEDALMLPKKDVDAANVVWLALTVLCGFVFGLCILLIWRVEIAAALGLPAIAPWLLLVPPTLLAMRSAKVAELWLIRTKQFRSVSAGQVTGTSTMVATRIGAGLQPFQAGVGGLIGGFFMGHLATVIVLGWSVIRHHARLFIDSFHVSGMAEAAHRYRRFPLFSTPATLIAALIARLPFFLLPLYFDVAVVGLFGRAFNMLAIPLSLIGGAVARVFFVHAAEAHREERLPEITLTVHKRLVMLGLFPTLTLVLAGPDIFEIIFGAHWREAGTFVQYVGPWLFLAAVASPLTRLFDVLERQRLDFATSVLMFFAMGTALIVGGRTGNVLTTLFLLGTAGASVRFLQLGVLLRLANVRYASALHAYGRYVLFSLPGLLLVIMAMTMDHAWVTTVAATIAGLIYAGLVLWQDRLLAWRS